MTLPRFEIIKQNILNHIERGKWRPGDAVPSENQLAERFAVSRMTARRALSELTDAGVLERVQGAGTFVAARLPTGSLLEIRNIADEITDRGHHHRANVLCLEARCSDEHVKHLLGSRIGQRYWYSRILHYENEIPLQLEERFVNAEHAPQYLTQDFEHITPSAYLTQLAPLAEADHWVEAVTLDDARCRLLGINKRHPCLKISRRTYSRRVNKNTKTKNTLTIVNFAYLYHPGERYRLGGHLNF